MSFTPTGRRCDAALRQLIPDATPWQRRLTAIAIAAIVVVPGVVGVTGVGPSKFKWGMYSNSDHHAVHESRSEPATE